MDLCVRTLSDLPALASQPFSVRRKIHYITIPPALFTTQEWISLCGGLQKFSCVVAISVEGHVLDSAVCHALASWLKEQRILRSFVFSRNICDLQAVLDIAQALHSVRTLNSLACNSLNASYDFLQSMLRESGVASRLHHLSFANNLATEKGLEFAQILPTLCPFLRTLIAGQSFFIKEQSINGLCILLSLPNLKRLQINGAHFLVGTETDKKPQGSGALRILYARMIQGDRYALETFQSCIFWEQLSSLSLSHNPWLSQDFFLHTYKWDHLRWLDLSYCRLSCEHDLEMKTLYASAPHLIGLSLQGNFGLHASLSFHIEALQEHRCLSWINISGLSGTSLDTKNVLHSLCALPDLSTLICHDADLSDSLFQEFLVQAEEQTCLTDISCEQNSLPISTMFLCQALCKRQKIRLQSAVDDFQNHTKLSPKAYRFLKAHLYSHSPQIWKIFPITLRKKFLAYQSSLYRDKDLRSLDEFEEDYELSQKTRFLHNPFYSKILQG